MSRPAVSATVGKARWRPGIGAGLQPGLDAVRRRDIPALRADLIAGLTVAAYLVPQVLAYAELAGLPAVAGLWAAVLDRR